MSKLSSAVTLESFENQPLRSFTEKAYLDYSMYVILDRALPHIADGLKPVQRRIVYAMSELGLSAQAKYKKSARTVGDVLGKFHPHGDSACYEAMVLMAQAFSYRYPLIDGQGNWGSPDDPKSFAAMRYTESRLAKYTESLLAELTQGTVDWVPNFDATLDEPKRLPARLPNLLLNGSVGIAVGMSTDIPPHNLTEVVHACVCLLDKPEASLEELFEHIKGPDFPTNAEIVTPLPDLHAMYQRGTGSLRLRSVYHQEKNRILITALPYQVSGAKIIEQIAAQIRDKKLPLVVDVRDESDHENPTQLAIVLRSDRVDAEKLMAHLFATTDLEQTYRANFNVIGLDGKPSVKNLHAILTEWLQYRMQTVRRRLQFRLEKILDRLHQLEGFLIAFLNLDQVIFIIRTEDSPKPVLMQQLKLTALQAESILELRLRHLAKLEEMKIRSEQKELSHEADALQATLGSHLKLKRLVRTELLEDAEKYGDPRRSPLVSRPAAQALQKEEVTSTEPVTVILSSMGWVRSAKSHEINPSTLSYKTGDQLKIAVSGYSHQPSLFMDSTGRVYSTPAHTLPSARGQGEPLTSRFNLPVGATVESVIIGDPKQHVLLSSSAGYGFVAPLEKLICKNRAGKAVLKLSDHARVLPMRLVQHSEDDWLAILSDTGHLLIIPVKELPTLYSGKGNKLITLPPEGSVLDILAFKTDQSLKLDSKHHHLIVKNRDLKRYLGRRAQRGQRLQRKYHTLEACS